MRSVVVQALARGVASQFRPRMLALLVVPVVVTLAFWVFSAWFAWEPVTAWLRKAWFGGDGAVAAAMQWFAAHGLGGLERWLPNAFAFLLLVPLAIATALGLVGVVAMPGVMAHLAHHDYADVERRGSLGIGTSLGNLAITMAWFVPGYLLTLPLWFVPPLALVVPWLWWGWLTARLMRLDSLLEHASPAERQALIRSDRWRYWVLGMATAALNYVPPLFLVAPVLSALVFGHYSLARLRALRASRPEALT